MTMTELAHLLPVPGPVWGDYPMRADDDRAPAWRRPALRSAGAACRRVAHLAHCASQDGANTDALQAVRLRLRRDGLTPAAVAAALGLVARTAADTLGWTARPTQLLAAAALLDNRMVEMATGEGKTLAIGLAAAVAALAGLPVHVVTANDYLAARDAARLAPLFEALGLRAAALAGVSGESARRAVYSHPIVYATAKDLAFDFLRDRLGGAGQAALSGLQRAAARLASPAADGPTAPLLRGLCMALLDEADSILLDEAEVPLILSRAAPHAARRAFLWQALALARGLSPGRDFSLQPADRCARLSAVGEERVADLAASLGGPWLRPRYRREAVLVALAALHLYRRDEHYLVKDGAIELLDEITGRIALGRVWSRGLHSLVALKEGLRAPAETETLAQTTFQRFFQRYWRLGGISGTLNEASAELRAVYGAAVVTVPLHRRCLRATLPARHFNDRDALFSAVVERACSLRAAGRPVLIGTDSVDASQDLAARLRAAGIDAAVLNARHDADEAAIVAAAGRAGQVTVATRMAGRGTDIELDPAALAAGGLHVIACQHQLSRRLDRQLAGRAGRHGDPGSVESWRVRHLHASAPQEVAEKGRIWKRPNAIATWLQDAIPLLAWSQWREERRRAGLRRRLLEQDQHWERRLSFAGRSA
ncbi:hypothetical protein BH11PSE10_BH11PSE10_14380 [soil metagenome]